MHRPFAGKLWRLKEAGLWNLEPTGYFEEGRYLSFTPPKVPHPLPPAAIEPYRECVARQQRGEASATYDGWWAPSQPAPCVEPIPLYPDKNGDQGVTISEARTIAPRLQAHLAPRDRRTALHAACTLHALGTHAARTLQAHLKMAARYLVALRDGMAAAWLLNRTFVFPMFECMCDRSEWPDVVRDDLPPRDPTTLAILHYTHRPHHPHHPPLLPTPPRSTQVPTCRLENSDLEFPFGCPLNFLINVHFMQGIENGARGQRGVPYREHSFLSNPRLAPRLRTSRASVRFSRERPTAHAEAGNMVTLPRGATDRELLAALGPGSAHDETAVLLLED